MEDRPRPWWGDGRVYLLLGLTLVTLTAGWMLKERCHDRPWDGYQWREYCYSDVQALHGTRGAGDGTWPYVETFNEYPPLTGLFMHAMGSLGTDRDSYLFVTALALGALALATTVILGELVGRDRRLLYWTLAPALALYAFYNWDLLAIAPAAGALLAFRRGRMGTAGLLLGLGACAKLFPAFMAPALGLWILAEDRRLAARGWRFGLGFTGVWTAIHLPLFLLNPEQTLEAYRFQAERSPNFESLWYSLGHLGREWGWDWLDSLGTRGPADALGLAALLGSVAFSGWAVWTRRLDPVVAACLPVFAFLATNKVFSLQYSLWAIPLLIVCRVPTTHKALVVVADLAVFLTLADYFHYWERLNDGHLFTAVAFAALFRAGVYVSVVVAVMRGAFPGPGTSPAARPVLREAA